MNKPNLLGIYRLLTPANQSELLAWVHLACFAENSARKSLGFGPEGPENGTFIGKAQEYSCMNNTRRSEK
jgi:hypothetical protein